MPKICRKCNEKFPFWVEIDNKRRNLTNRKFCLKCSPFDKHNTVKLDETTREESLVKRNNLSKIRVSKIRKRNQENAREYLGGKCSVCGYNKCSAALEFHHKDEGDKRVNMSILWTCKWESILEEIHKCILVCANCHREIHYS